jgi:transposase
MITVGVDAHKRINEAIAVDDRGAEVSRWRGTNDATGWAAVAQWANECGESRQFGVEGAWGYGRGLAQYLVAQGGIVYEVNPRWTAAMRRRARREDKTDHLDARAVALFVRQEAPDLPAVTADDETVALDVLSTERDAALCEATRLRNQIHALLSQLDPHYRIIVPSLKTATGLERLKQYEAPGDAGPGQQARAAAVRRVALRLELALGQVDELAKQIRDLAAPSFEPLTRICGVNLLTAGTLAGILGPGRRFASEAALARYAGVAPLETSSAERVRHRLNRGGNRRLNAILYRIVLTQAHHSREARAYLDRRISEGKTRKEAFRALKRYVARAIFRFWIQCLEDKNAAVAPSATCGCT